MGGSLLPTKFLQLSMACLKKIILKLAVTQGKNFRKNSFQIMSRKLADA